MMASLISSSLRNSKFSFDLVYLFSFLQIIPLILFLNPYEKKLVAKYLFARSVYRTKRYAVVPTIEQPIVHTLKLKDWPL